uniref:Histone H1 n=1 Tax=Anthurium amnicola TaxID=1678845 RepID=A0A1D1ZC55_9ARAE
MGAPKQKWTAEEEEALRAGVSKHGAGKWRTIQKDPDFSRCLASRSNIDLKDKWRNMSLCSGQGSREKPRVPRIKGITAASLSSAQTTTTSASVKQDGLSAVIDPSTNAQDTKISPKYTTMIIEALSNVKEPHGLEVGAICSYIEQRHDVPPNFRRLLGSKLRRLVAQNKIEKVEKGYKLKDSSFATKTPTPKQKDPAYRSKPPQLSMLSGSIDLVGDAAIAAAYKIAEAEAKSFLASEAVKEAERVSKMAEETDSLLMLAREIFEQCSRGEIVTIA